MRTLVNGSRIEVLRAIALVMVVSMSACGAGGAGGEGPDAGPMGDAGPGDDEPVPAAFSGVFHLPLEQDSMNLTFLTNSSHGSKLFVLSAFGCDYCVVEGGNWQVMEQGEALVLVPGFDRSTMPWFFGGSLNLQVSSATVRAGRGADQVVVRVVPANGDAPFEQVWSRGRVCAVCTGELGPEGKEVCEAPLTEREEDACVQL